MPFSASWYASRVMPFRMRIAFNNMNQNRASSANAALVNGRRGLQAL